MNSPGWFLPGQLSPLASVLGRPLVEIFRSHLAIGTTLMPDGESRLGVMPHKLRDFKKPGRIWTLAELADPGRCIFYDRGRCTIYAQRPYECARMQHTHTALQTRQLRYFIVEQWGSRQLAPFLKWAGKHRAPRTGRRRA